MQRNNNNQKPNPDPFGRKIQPEKLPQEKPEKEEAEKNIEGEPIPTKSWGFHNKYNTNPIEEKLNQRRNDDKKEKKVDFSPKDAPSENKKQNVQLQEWRGSTLTIELFEGIKIPIPEFVQFSIQTEIIMIAEKLKKEIEQVTLLPQVGPQHSRRIREKFVKENKAIFEECKEKKDEKEEKQSEKVILDDNSDLQSQMTNLTDDEYAKEQIYQSYGKSVIIDKVDQNSTEIEKFIINSLINLQSQKFHLGIWLRQREQEKNVHDKLYNDLDYEDFQRRDWFSSFGSNTKTIGGQLTVIGADLFGVSFGFQSFKLIRTLVYSYFVQSFSTKEGGLSLALKQLKNIQYKKRNSEDAYNSIKIQRLIYIRLLQLADNAEEAKEFITKVFEFDFLSYLMCVDILDTLRHLLAKVASKKNSPLVESLKKQEYQDTFQICQEFAHTFSVNIYLFDKKCYNEYVPFKKNPKFDIFLYCGDKVISLDNQNIYYLQDVDDVFKIRLQGSLQQKGSKNPNQQKNQHKRNNSNHTQPIEQSHPVHNNRPAAKQQHKAENPLVNILGQKK